MKKLICLLVLSSAAFAHTEEKNYFFYGQTQMVAIVPTAGVGIRAHKDVNGFDLSVTALFSSPVVGSHLRGLYLLYPAKRGFYFGAGPGFVAGASPMDRWHGTAAATAETAMGYQWKNHKFLELNTITILSDECDFITIPGITLGFGF